MTDETENPCIICAGDASDGYGGCAHRCGACGHPVCSAHIFRGFVGGAWDEFCSTECQVLAYRKLMENIHYSRLATVAVEEFPCEVSVSYFGRRLECMNWANGVKKGCHQHLEEAKPTTAQRKKAARELRSEMREDGDGRIVFLREFKVIVRVMDAEPRSVGGSYCSAACAERERKNYSDTYTNAGGSAHCFTEFRWAWRDYGKNPDGQHIPRSISDIINLECDFLKKTEFHVSDPATAAALAAHWRAWAASGDLEIIRDYGERAACWWENWGGRDPKLWLAHVRRSRDWNR